MDAPADDGRAPKRPRPDSPDAAPAPAPASASSSAAAAEAGEAALLQQVHALESTNASLRRSLTDAREASIAHAEARLVAARALHVPRSDVERLLLDVLAARGGGGGGGGGLRAPLDPEARVRALLTPPSAPDWDASDPAAAAALAAGGGGAVADLGGVRVALRVGPAAGAVVSLTDMLAWSPARFAATYAAAGSTAASLLAGPLAEGRPPPPGALRAAARVYAQMRCFTKAWAAAHPTSIHAALSLIGFTDASGAAFLSEGADGGGAAPEPAAVVAAQTDRLRLTRAQVATILALRAAYLARVRGLAAGREAALAVLERAILGGSGDRAVGRAECVAALDAADTLRASLQAQVDAEIELSVGLSYAASDAQCGAWVAQRYPRAAALIPLVEEVAARAGAPPAVVVLASG